MDDSRDLEIDRREERKEGSKKQSHTGWKSIGSNRIIRSKRKSQMNYKGRQEEIHRGTGNRVGGCSTAWEHENIV